FGGAPAATPIASLLEAGGTPPSTAIDAKADVVVLPYSSGTTGRPKGVLLTHRNLVANICQTEAVFPAEAERVIAVLPFYHIYGLTVLLNISLHRGDMIVTMPRFDLEQFLGLMQDHAITRVYLLPPIVPALANRPALSRYGLRPLCPLNSRPPTPHGH